MRFLTILWALLCVGASSLYAQYDITEDILGRPVMPVIGILNTDRAPEVPRNVAEQISISFTNGLKNPGGAPAPFTIVNKKLLSIAVELLRDGKNKADLVGTNYWSEMVSAQYLLRLDINSFKLIPDLDSVYSAEKRLERVDKFTMARANLTVRLVDVATSKVLMLNNFDAGGTTRGFQEFKNQSDSARAVMQLNNKVRDYAKSMFYSISAAPRIKSLVKESKDKAEEVALEKTPLNYLPNETGFKVYAVYKTYEVEGQSIRDAELAGVINKGKGFQHALQNFEVLKGEKRIAQLFKAGTPLLVVWNEFPLGPFMPSVSRVGITLQDFKNTAGVNSSISRVLQDYLSEMVSRRPLLFDVVDREVYRLIQLERELQSETKSDATQAGISVGSDYLFNVELLDYKSSSNLVYKTIEEAVTTNTKPGAANTPSQPASKPAKIPSEGTTKDSKVNSATDPGKNKISTTAPAQPQTVRRKVPDKYLANNEVRLNVSLTSVKTGEVVFTNAYTYRAEAELTYNRDKYDEIRCQSNAFSQLAGRVSSGIWADLQKALNPEIRLLDLLETGKNGPEKILIAGGIRSGFTEGMRVEVVEVVEEMVDGQALNRDVVIGELSIVDVRPETSVCKVKNGEKELAEKWNTKGRVYGRRKM